MEILLPHQVEQVRAGRVEYGTVEHVTAKRASFCRCCGGQVTKGDAALRFFWDMGDCGSWTAGQMSMHVACEPTDEATRTRANMDAIATRLEKLAEKTFNKADNASRDRTVRRLEREAQNYADRAAKIRAELEQVQA